MKDEQSGKRGTYPLDLARIVCPFSERSINVDKLKYESVRADYQRWVGSRDLVGRFGHITMLAHLVSLAATTVLAFHGHGYAALTSAISSGGMRVLADRLFNEYEKEPEGTQHELKEFDNLFFSAGLADLLMNKHDHNATMSYLLANN